MSSVLHFTSAVVTMQPYKTQLNSIINYLCWMLAVSLVSCYVMELLTS